VTLDAASRNPRPTRVPVAAPPRIATRLESAPDGPAPVLHSGRDLVHLDVAGGAVGVAATGAPGLPHCLRTNLVSLSSSGVSTAYVDSGILHLDGRALVVGRLVDVRAPRLDSARIPKASPVVVQGTPRSHGAGLVAGPDHLEVRPTEVRPSEVRPTDVRHIDAAAVAGLVGRGDGLTPLGDDVLCGWLAAHRAAGVATSAVDDAVRRALPRTTTLSATLLECALAGEVADLAAGYLRALGTPSERTARAALAALGHSSGEGLAHGIDVGVAQLAGRAAA